MQHDIDSASGPLFLALQGSWSFGAITGGVPSRLLAGTASAIMAGTQAG